MNKNLKSVNFKMFVGLVMVVALAFNAYPKVIANFSPEGYDDCGKSGIQLLVIEGAGYFLKSHSDFLMFLNKFELSDIESVTYLELQQYIGCASVNIGLAAATYTSLSCLAAVTPYDDTVIAALQTFDYDAFQDRYDLNADIFKEVESYLKAGDIRGVYDWLESDCRDILRDLGSLSLTLTFKKLPAMSSVWPVGQKYVKIFLFGQYIAQVFSEITGKE